ncbi:PREDICTED: uncharacterized protein LOC106119676 [Papilio xuthus]|uniref:Uncharacterized protein LOC106119676 n=1 Tax=Papilio xuthus TaxID=66420 RepID=A0AAJ6ZDK3_PAPXU|nr:PREDICTED: uncharacterized protein LOC106119676 [Papilio xuthus]
MSARLVFNGLTAELGGERAAPPASPEPYHELEIYRQLLALPRRARTPDPSPPSREEPERRCRTPAPRPARPSCTCQHAVRPAKYLGSCALPAAGGQCAAGGQIVADGQCGAGGQCEADGQCPVTRGHVVSLLLHLLKAARAARAAGGRAQLVLLEVAPCGLTVRDARDQVTADST